MAPPDSKRSRNPIHEEHIMPTTVLLHPTPGFSDLPMALAWIRRNANAWTVFHLDRLENRNELVFAQYILPA